MILCEECAESSHVVDKKQRTVAPVFCFLHHQLSSAAFKKKYSLRCLFNIGFLDSISVNTATQRTRHRNGVAFVQYENSIMTAFTRLGQIFKETMKLCKAVVLLHIHCSILGGPPVEVNFG